MFYGKESITETLALIRNKTSGVIHIPMQIYKHGERWTDEFRIRDGHIKLEDGTWVTEVDVGDYLNKLEKDILDLYTSYQTNLEEIRLLKQQRYEMEYGLRVAEKSLKKSLAMTKELIQD
jgi:predicted DNA-binding protein (UPF0278 family)